MCITPLRPGTSAIATGMPLILIMPLPSFSTNSSCPSTVRSLEPCCKSAERRVPVTTWYESNCVSKSTFSGFVSASSASGGSAKNAWSLGAKIVNGPTPSSVASNLAWRTVPTNVRSMSAFAAFSKSVCSAVISTPPTFTLAGLLGPQALSTSKKDRVATMDERVIQKRVG